MLKYRENFWPIILFAFTFLSACPAAPDLSAPSEVAAALRGKQLASAIGCAQCHADLPQNASFRQATPDLSSAGLRYQPAWIFEFVQNPSRVRQHLGRARMPAFPISKKEGLALTAFLETQREPSGNWPPIPVAVAALDTTPRPTVSKEQFHGEMARGLICLTCHDYAGQGGHRAVEMTNVSLRLRRTWVTRYLSAPAMFGVPATTMPAQFFELTPDRSGFRELADGAARKIQIVTDHLFSLNSERRDALERNLIAAQRQFPEVTAAQGQALFRSLNCAACHRHNSIAPRQEQAAPSLACEGLRVQKKWLENFLARPVPVRPFGCQPGDGSRMPDFHLAPDEIRDLSIFLLSQREGPERLKGEYYPATRTAFAVRKAELLLNEKLSCLGCHRFGAQGGRIGPDLTTVRQRLQPSYILEIIRDPRAVAPHSIMPKAPIPDEAARLVADFLLQHQQSSDHVSYLSPLECALIHTTDPIQSGSRASKNYLRYCAACHGATGQGDGFNAVFLKAKPARHADAALMGGRPDDTLFDGIHAGGYILNKSPLMPAWGGSLSAVEIGELVRHIRTLCRCEGPTWSREESLKH